MELLTNIFTKENIATFIVCAIIIGILITLFRIIKFIVRKVAGLTLKLFFIILVFAIIYGLNKNIPNLLMNFLLCLVFIGSLYYLEGKKINLPKEKRNLHFLMPWFAFLYSFILIFCTNIIKSILLKIFTWLGAFIPDFIKVIVINITTWISTKLPFIGEINLGKYIYYAYCISIVLGFLLIKMLFIKWLPSLYESYKNFIDRFKFKDDSKLQYILKNIYYNENEETAYLKKKYENSEFLLQWIYYCAWFFAGFTMILAQLWASKKLIPTAYYPVFVLLILGEIYYFFCGIRKTEDKPDPKPNVKFRFHAENEFTKWFNFNKLYSELKETYENKDKKNNYRILKTYPLVSEGDIKGKEVDFSDDPISTYFRELSEDGEDINDVIVKEITKLINGESVLISTPFYRDLTPYLVLPIIRYLMAFKKVLILVGHDNLTKDIKKWITDGIINYYGQEQYKNLWKTEIIKDEVLDCDIALISMSDIYISNILNNIEFINKFGFVILIEPHSMIATGQLALPLISERLKAQNNDIVYCAIDKKSDGLFDRLKSILKVDRFSVCNSIIKSKSINCFVINWATENGTLKNITEYLNKEPANLSDGLILSLFGLKYKVPNTTLWISNNRFPVKDWKDEIKGLREHTKKYLGHEDVVKLDKELEVATNYWCQERTGAAFITIEDELNSLFETASLFNTRALNTCFINILCDNYLLRDYMADNSQMFILNPNIIVSLSPEFTKDTDRNILICLILKMLFSDIGEEELSNELQKIKFETGDITEEKYKSISDNVIDKDNFVKFEMLISLFCDIPEIILKDQLEIKTNNTYRIKAGSQLEIYANSCLYAQLIVGGKTDNIYLSRKLIYQKYLPEQYITYDGEYYRIDSISEDNNINISRQAARKNDRHYYRQTREYAISGLETFLSSSNSIECKVSSCKISVKTTGYLKLISNYNFYTSNHVLTDNIPDRTYKNKKILRLKLNNVEDIKVTRSFAVIINELFMTLFPENYHYISAMVAETSEIIKDNNINKILHNLTHDSDNDPSTIYIIEDSEVDIGLLDAVKNKLNDIFDIITDYLDWQYGDGEVVSFQSNEGTELAKDEVHMEEGIMKQYLNFGFENQPDIFDFINLYNYLKPKDDKHENRFTEARKAENLNLNEKYDADYFNDIDAVYCDFCAKKIEKDFNETKARKDGRRPCSGCEGDSIDKPEQLMRIFEKALRDMKFFFGHVFDTEHIGVWFKEHRDIAEICKEPETTFTKAYDKRTQSTFIKEESNGVADYIIYVENLAPYLTILGNIVHELTKIWVDMSNSEKDPIASDAMAIWTQIQYFLYINKGDYAKRLILLTINHDPVKGLNLLEYYNEYGFNDIHNIGINNFMMDVFDAEVQSVKGAISPFDNQDNSLKDKLARKKIDSSTDHICDYCGAVIRKEEEFEVLKDGLERCMKCSALSLKNKKEFVELLEEVKDKYSKHFGVKINKPMKVFVVNAERIAKERKLEFKTTNGFDGRSQAFARSRGSKRDNHEIWLERGAPRASMEDSIVHELTHIWQFENWDYVKNESKYGEENQRMLEEGHAMWTELQYYLYENNLELSTRKINNLGNFSEHNRNVNFDYHRGLLEYYHQYGFVDKFKIGVEEMIEKFNLGNINKNGRNTPFEDSSAPIDVPIKWTKEEWEKRFE